jgi:hypothetical protein
LPTRQNAKKKGVQFSFLALAQNKEETMFLCSIPYDEKRKRFHVQYPHVLQNYGIDPHQFEKTVDECNQILEQGEQRLEVIDQYMERFLLISFSVFIIVIALLTLCVFLLALYDMKKLVAIPVVFTFVLPLPTFFLLFLIYVHLRKTKRINAHLDIQMNLTAFLEDQNDSVYLPRQLDIFLEGYYPERVLVGYGSKMLENMSRPSIQIFSISSGNSPTIP